MSDVLFGKMRHRFVKRLTPRELPNVSLACMYTVHYALGPVRFNDKGRRVTRSFSDAC